MIPLMSVVLVAHTKHGEHGHECVLVVVVLLLLLIQRRPEQASKTKPDVPRYG